ncbi:MAG: DUF1587 domain-containing protein, partial [Verrucomicrobiota bacterium]
MKRSLLTVALALGVTVCFAEPTRLPEHVDSFLVEYCLDCHDEQSEKGGINLDFLEIDWSDPHAAVLWGKAWDMLEGGDMPPEEKKQPSEKESLAVIGWLGEELLENDRPGGTVLRRLSQEEYENSVSDILKVPFSVPEGFPTDTVYHGFDNSGEGLVLSPPLMAQYLEIATAAADSVIPPPVEQRRTRKETTSIGPGDFTLNFTTGHEMDGVLRMVLSSDPLARGSVWPNRFEAKVAGVYRIKIDLSAYRPSAGHVPVVQLLSYRADGNSFTSASGLAKLAEFEVREETPNTFRADVELQRGETVVVHYENAPLSSDQRDKNYNERIAGQLLDMFRADRELGAAWMKAGYQRSDRGWSWLERIEAVRAEGGLDVAGFDAEASEVREFALRMARQPVNLVETMSCYLFETGPGVDIHRMAIIGPMPSDRKRVELPADEFSSMDYTGNLTEAQRYRMISSRGTVAGSAVWPSRFEAKISGIYRVQFDATAFVDGEGLYRWKDDAPYLIELYALPSADNLYEPIESIRKIGDFRLGSQVGQVQNFIAEVKLQKGETLALRWANGPLYSDKGETDYSVKAFGELVKNKRIHAVLSKIGPKARELAPAKFYEEVMRLVKEGQLNLDDPALKQAPKFESGQVRNAFMRVARQDLILHGPALDLVRANVEGPIRLVEDNEMKEQRLRTARFLGEREGRSDRDYAEAILRPFLDLAFRRPVTDTQLGKYLNIALSHQASGHRFEDGIHLAVRAALCSPNLLYRGQREGQLDDYDLASRLSYFLASAPPDSTLRKVAASGELSDPEELEAQARRLLGHSRVKNFLKS